MNKISVQIHQLTGEAIGQIRDYIKENGTIDDLTAGKDIDFIGIYFDNADYPNFGHYEKIELKDGQIVVSLEGDESVTLYENDLTTNHVLDILNIIEEIKRL